MLSVISSIILILRFAPVEHPNKPLSASEKSRLRKLGIISAFSIFALVLIMSVFTLTRRFGMYISLGQLTASTAMLCEIIKHTRVNNKRED